MRRYKINYESVEGIWLLYIGICILGLSFLYFIFFISKWPYPAEPFLALILSFLVSSSFFFYGHLYKDKELMVRKTYLSAGLGAYILWYVLFVRATIYCNAGYAYHAGLACLLILALSFMFYSMAVEGNWFPNTRRK